VLATAGIYGVTAYLVTQRTREIGVRIALGAQWRDVLKLILRSGIFLVTIGLTIGLAGALALTRLMTTLLFEVSPTDPITFAAVALCVILATLLSLLFEVTPTDWFTFVIASTVLLDGGATRLLYSRASRYET
jgi:ABC-type antimicrobial peptide transport system permease subunit